MNVVEVQGLHHTYLSGTPFAATALRDVSMHVRDGEFLGLVGPSRSGKSTLIQFFNGLLVPQQGRVDVFGTRVEANRKRTALRQQVGVVFQYAESQLFAESVADDVAFGPRNFGVPEHEIDGRVNNALLHVNLDPEVYGPRPVSELSGGEKRRAAIAGVLASTPRLIVLDEPTAGIDPQTRRSLLSWLVSLKHSGMTVVVATNSAAEIAALADRFVVLEEGAVVAEGPPADIFEDEDLTRRTGTGRPDAFEILRRLRAEGHDVPRGVPGPAEAADAIYRLLRAGAAGGGS